MPSHSGVGHLISEKNHNEQIFGAGLYNVMMRWRRDAPNDNDKKKLSETKKFDSKQNNPLAH